LLPILIKEKKMKYLLLALLLSLNVFAQDVPEEPPAPAPEKMYYTSGGWFGPWPVVEIGTETANGTPECEATLLEDGRPVSRSWVKLAGDGKVSCPVEIDLTRKNTALGIAAVREAINSKKQLMSCGNDLIASLGLSNASKGLTKVQRKKYIKDFADIFDQIKAGSLDLAVEDIADIAADGVVVTEQEKTDVIAKLNECMGL